MAINRAQVEAYALLDSMGFPWVDDYVAVERKRHEPNVRTRAFQVEAFRRMLMGNARRTKKRNAKLYDAAGKRIVEEAA